MTKFGRREANYDAMRVMTGGGPSLGNGGLMSLAGPLADRPDPDPTQVGRFYLATSQLPPAKAGGLKVRVKRA